MDSSTSPANIDLERVWIKWGLLAAGSALAGGLATAWWYRRTLEQLRQPHEPRENPHLWISVEDRDDEV
jgi:hypothetical protein